MSSIPSIDELVEAHVASVGPGAAVAVIHNGEVVHRAAYGYANLETQTPMAPDTAFRICSVSKQFTCLLIRLLEHEGRLDLDASPCRYLDAAPSFMEGVSIRQLCQNVSGLRDYWCVAMLTGAEAETRFRRADAERIIFAQSDFQSPPGSAYNYNNGNFTMLGWIIEAVTGQSYSEVLAARILRPLGMSNTFVPASTSVPLPGGSTGYEPTTNGGIAPAVVDINWEADAGIVSTLDDLCRWERHFDTEAPNYSNPVCATEILRSLFDTPTLIGGVASDYGFGLRLGHYRGFPTQGHEGGLRGWRMCRIRFPTESLSVIVLFNHLADAGAMARRVADCLLPGKPTRSSMPPASVRKESGTGCDPRGFYLDEESARGFEIIEEDDVLVLNAMGQRALLADDGRGSFTTANGDIRITCVAGDQPAADVRIFSGGFARRLPRRPLNPISFDFARCAGRYHSAALQSTLDIEILDGLPSVSVSGPLGVATGWPVRIIAADVLGLECRRSLDYQPPGEFVLWFPGGNDGRGSASEVVAACGMAHSMRFQREATG